MTISNDINNNKKSFSGSEIIFLNNDFGRFVRKINNIDRNLERYDVLSALNIRMPLIFEKGNNYYDMEFIDNIDIKSFIQEKEINTLFEFIRNFISKISEFQKLKNYFYVYEEKLKDVNWNFFSFSKEKLIAKLPVFLPQTIYHGDFTLDNMLYDKNQNNFVLIDPITSVYDSFIFDLAKLNQDLTCGWFIRNEKKYSKENLQKLSKLINSYYKDFYDTNLIILMLLRILPYCKEKEDQQFIINNVENLWIS